jgi:hypothetical protein
MDPAVNDKFDNKARSKGATGTTIDVEEVYIN